MSPSPSPASLPEFPAAELAVMVGLLEQGSARLAEQAAWLAQHGPALSLREAITLTRAACEGWSPGALRQVHAVVLPVPVEMQLHDLFSPMDTVARETIQAMVPQFLECLAVIMEGARAGDLSEACLEDVHRRIASAGTIDLLRGALAHPALVPFATSAMTGAILYGRADFFAPYAAAGVSFDPPARGDAYLLSMAIQFHEEACFVALLAAGASLDLPEPGWLEEEIREQGHAGWLELLAVARTARALEAAIPAGAPALPLRM